MKIKLLELVVFFVTITSTIVQATEIDKIDIFDDIGALIVDEVVTSRTPSLQVAIGYKSKIIYENAYGFANLENKIPATRESKYRTASIAKWFTATAAMTLVQDGLLDLDKPIQNYCPEFPEKRWPITARQLLTHTAGVRGYLDFQELIKNSKNTEQADLLKYKQAQAKMSQHTRYVDVIKPLDLFKDDPLVFEPDTNWSYTSFGYRILACVMEGASSKKFQALMDETIFKKLNMNNTVADDAWAIIPNRVSGYQLGREGTIRRADSRDVSENLPAGGYLSTASDLVKFALAFNDDLVSSKIKELMLSPVAVKEIDIKSEKTWRDAMPHKARYGYGIMLWSKYEPGMIGHTGRQAGAASILILIPDKNLSIAVMSNAKGWNGYLGFVMKLLDLIEKSGGVESLNKTVLSKL